MSLTPLFNDWWNNLDVLRGMDQHFGSPVDLDVFRSARALDYLNYPLRRRNRRRYHSFHPFHHALASRRHRGNETESSDIEKFPVTFDVHQFSPEEINVKVVDGNCVVVEAKHEEREDEHGWVSRKFVRRCGIPEEFDSDKVQVFLSSDGILTIFAIKKEPEGGGERIIPIQYTGAPAMRHGDEEGARLEERQRREGNEGRGDRDVVHAA